MLRNIEPYRKRWFTVTFSVKYAEKTVEKGNCFSSADVLH